MIATVCNSVTRFNLRQEQTNGWRYFIDTIEVKLPEQLEPYLQQKNVMELVETNHLPLIISLNGFSLKDFSYEWSSEEATEVTTPEAAIHERGEPNVQLLRVRKETLEEHQLNHSSGWFGAILICLSFLLGYLALVAIPVVQSWGFVGAFLCFVIGLLALFRFRVFPKKFQDVQCVFGQPKRWELYGELDKRQSSTVSIGGTIFIIHPIGSRISIMNWIKRQISICMPQGKFYGMDNTCHCMKRNAITPIVDIKKIYWYSQRGYWF